MGIQRLVRAWLVAALIACSALAARQAVAQEDAEASVDHPLVPRVPGYYIFEYSFKELDSFRFTLPGGSEQVAQGEHWTIQYMLRTGQKRSSIIDILRQHRILFEKMGGTVLAQDTEWGVLLQWKTPTGELSCLVRAANDGDQYVLNIVQKGEMIAKAQPTAADLAKTLADKGSLTLPEIAFEPGKALLKAESTEVLALVGELLRADPTLKLEIHAHTDNSGKPLANRTLSQQRAEAVKQYLIKTLTVAAKRLKAKGFGDTRPVESNATEAGRAANCRVEFVKK